MRGATRYTVVLPDDGYFNPRSPCGERLRSRFIYGGDGTFQSTLPMRGATPTVELKGGDFMISIHAPHAGSDRPIPGGNVHQRISIHAPHAGSDLCMYAQNAGDPYFNPRSPCGERLYAYVLSYSHREFQSTLPMRGATPVHENPGARADISIHAPHAGSDPRKI